MNPRGLSIHQRQLSAQEAAPSAKGCCPHGELWMALRVSSAQPDPSNIHSSTSIHLPANRRHWREGPLWGWHRRSWAQKHLEGEHCHPPPPPRHPASLWLCLSWYLCPHVLVWGCAGEHELFPQFRVQEHVVDGSPGSWCHTGPYAEQANSRALTWFSAQWRRGYISCKAPHGPAAAAPRTRALRVTPERLPLHCNVTGCQGHEALKGPISPHQPLPLLWYVLSFHRDGICPK